MSITSALFTGVSGLLNNGEAMNVIGNNIANVNTIGYKDARSVFSDLLSVNIGNNSQIGRGVQLQAVQNLFSQGSSQNSENTTDLAIQGNSFFALANPGAAGTANPSVSLLSRAGSFHVDKNLTLVNPDGYQVLDNMGQPIKFPTGIAADTDFAKVVKVEPNGLITYLATDGLTQRYYNGSGVAGALVSGGVPVAPVTVAAVTAADPTALTKVGGSLYKVTGAAGVSGVVWGAGTNQANGNSEAIVSNTLEGSNVDMASEFVRMIVTQRAYSANSKTITTADQMTQEVLNLIR